MEIIVLDTNVVISALRSGRGASFAILRHWRELAASDLGATVLEDEAIGLREASRLLASRVADREFIESRARLFNRAEFERAPGQIPDAEPEARDRR